MSNRIRRHLAVLIPLTGAALLAPLVAVASVPRGSGGSGITGGSGIGGGTVRGVLDVGSAITASGDGITLSTTPSGLVGRELTFSGSVPAAAGGDTVAIEYATAAKPRQWTQAEQATVNAAGQFVATWKATKAGRLSFAATLLAFTPAVTSTDGSSTTSGSSTNGGSALAGQTTTTATTTGAAPAQTTDPGTSPLTVTIFRSAIATIYGPGLWGHRTACGERLRKRAIGVASRTLKCGAKVDIYYRGRELVVPVIDRGPYGDHASWDLTEATAKALGITQTTTIGTLAQSDTR